mmetsp:Transcript_31323/g.93342  ORF Transcript_31323/g.93342 Transcript_31323/m.93342 type:complete len:231 (+) Transcript_31323:615-1307(+)
MGRHDLRSSSAISASLGSSTPPRTSQRPLSAPHTTSRPRWSRGGHTTRQQTSGLPASFFTKCVPYGFHSRPSPSPPSPTPSRRPGTLRCRLRPRPLLPPSTPAGPRRGRPPSLRAKRCGRWCGTSCKRTPPRARAWSRSSPNRCSPSVWTGLRATGRPPRPPRRQRRASPPPKPPPCRRRPRWCRRHRPGLLLRAVRATPESVRRTSRRATRPQCRPAMPLRSWLRSWLP